MIDLDIAAIAAGLGHRDFAVLGADRISVHDSDALVINDLLGRDDFDADAFHAQGLASSKEATLASIKAEHEGLLVQLSGSASVAERDTWPNQWEWAQTLERVRRWVLLVNAIKKAAPAVAEDLQPLLDDLDADAQEASRNLTGLLTVAEIAAINTAGGDPSGFMKSKIMDKVMAMGTLITTATRLKRTAEAMVDQAADVASVDAALVKMSASAQVAVSEFLQAVGG